MIVASEVRDEEQYLKEKCSNVGQTGLLAHNIMGDIFDSNMLLKTKVIFISSGRIYIWLKCIKHHRNYKYCSGDLKLYEYSINYSFSMCSYLQTSLSIWGWGSLGLVLFLVTFGPFAIFYFAFYILCFVGG